MRPNYRLRSEISITFCCQLCSTRYTAFRVRKAFMHIERNVAARPSYYRLKSEVSIVLHCWLYSTCYTAVQIKNCLKSTSAIRVATMNNTDNFHFEGKPSRATAKLTLFIFRKDEWDINKDTGKSMKNALYTAVCQDTSREK